MSHHRPEEIGYIFGNVDVMSILHGCRRLRVQRKISFV